MIADTSVAVAVIAAQIAILAAHIKIANSIWERSVQPPYRALAMLAVVSTLVWLSVGVLLLPFVGSVGEPGIASLSVRLFNASLWLPVFSTCLWGIGIFGLVGILFMTALIPGLRKRSNSLSVFWITIFAIAGCAYIFGIGAIRERPETDGLWVMSSAIVGTLIALSVLTFRVMSGSNSRKNSPPLLLGVLIIWSLGGATAALIAVLLGRALASSQPYWTGDLVLPYYFDVPKTILALTIGSIVGLITGLLATVPILRRLFNNHRGLQDSLNRNPDR